MQGEKGGLGGEDAEAMQRLMPSKWDLKLGQTRKSKIGEQKVIANDVSIK